MNEDTLPDPNLYNRRIPRRLKKKKSSKTQVSPPKRNGFGSAPGMNRAANKRESQKSKFAPVVHPDVLGLKLTSVKPRQSEIKMEPKTRLSTKVTDEMKRIFSDNQLMSQPNLLPWSNMGNQSHVRKISQIKKEEAQLQELHAISSTGSGPPHIDSQNFESVSTLRPALPDQPRPSTFDTKTSSANRRDLAKKIYDKAIEGKDLAFYEEKCEHVRKWAVGLIIGLWLLEVGTLLLASGTWTLKFQFLKSLKIIILVKITWKFFTQELTSSEMANLLSLFSIQIGLNLLSNLLYLREASLLSDDPCTSGSSARISLQVILLSTLFQNSLLSSEMHRNLQEKIRQIYELLAFFIAYGLLRTSDMIIDLSSLLSVGVLAAFLLGAAYSFSEVYRSCLELRRQEIQREKQENLKYRKMFNLLQEPILVVENARVIKFMNYNARRLYSNFLKSTQRHKELSQEASSSVVLEPLFFVFQKQASETKAKKRATKFFSHLKSSVEQGELSSDSQTEDEALHGSSLQDLIKMDREHLRDTIFTTNRRLCECDSVEKLDTLIEKLNNESVHQSTISGGDTYSSVKFFQVKIIEVDEGEEGQIMIQFIDISQRILGQSLRLEKEYLTMLNSTISHEMRNPLNSIQTQIQMQDRWISELETDLLIAKAGPSAGSKLTHLKQCLRIAQSSCKMLKFNVEDILALPQLKNHKFSKNIQKINIQEQVEEVIEILGYQADQKTIQVSQRFIGFPEFATLQSTQADQGQPSSPVRPNYLLMLDAQRFQQVLLNYFSNAMKFTTSNGKILVVVQLIRGSNHLEKEARASSNLIKKLRQEKHLTDAESLFEDILYEFYGEDFFSMDDSSDSCSQTFTKLASVQNQRNLFKSGREDMLVLSVLDTGTGIMEKDKGKLFKMFGCLNRTRKVNTKGIGLGLLISKMITEEFGGSVSFRSSFGVGSVFQASFLISEKAVEKKESTQIEQMLFLSEDMVKKRREQQLSKCIQNFQYAYPLGVFSRKRILVIDDEPFNCQVIASMFTILDLANRDDIVDYSFSGTDALIKVDQNLVSCSNLGQLQTKLKKKAPLADESSSFLNQTEDHLESSDFKDSSQFSKLEPDETVISSDSDEPVFSSRSTMVCKYGLIITDLSMPGMDGYQCAVNIRNKLSDAGIERKNQPTIVAVTGHVESEYILQAFDDGIDQVYSKPVDSTALSYLLMEHGFSIKVNKSVEDILTKRVE